MTRFVCFATLALVIGGLMDILLGDPRGWPHLIRGYGWVISKLERMLYCSNNKRAAGTMLAAVTIIVCAGIPAIVLLLAWKLSPFVYLILESLLCWQLLAMRSLRDESLPVYQALKRGDTRAARNALSMIVGRDTASLDEAGITRATVETVAENTADGVAAPLLYITFGGAALGCLYKAVNTMDSMIGYQNARYQDFGRAAARLDDTLNYLPARLCALAMIAAAWFCGMDAAGAIAIWRRDRRRHASPNSAQTEAVMAGALRIRLAGDAVYGGRIVRKPFIGDDTRPIEATDIKRAHHLLFATSGLLFGLSLLLRGIIYAAL